MKKKIPLLFLLALIIIATALGLYRHFTTKTRFNDTYVNGNSAGNLYNSGLFCESGDRIFFANPSDSGRLYSMHTDGTGLKKMCDDVATYINADANYVYYVRNNTNSEGNLSFLNVYNNCLCRIDRNGDEDTIQILDTKPCLYASLSGNYIYYLRYSDETATALWKVKIDGEGAAQVSKNPYFTSCADGQYIYYNGLERDHYLRRLDTVTDGETVLYEGNCWMPTVVNQAIAYYMDIDNNYALTSVNLMGGEKMTLCSDRIDCYNLAGNYIYFQRNDTSEPALCRMKTDGSGYEVIAEGNYTAINVTSAYVYFKDFITGTMYRTPTNTPGVVETFEPGK